MSSSMDSSVLSALFPMATDNFVYFLKLLVCDFSKELKIPPAFNKMLGAELPKNLPKGFVLKTKTYGRAWHVGMEMAADDILYLRKGWKEFAIDNCLRFGQILIFMYSGNIEFQVVRFGRNCLLKGFDKDSMKPFKAMARSLERDGDEGEDESTIQSDEEEKQKFVHTESPMQLNSVKKRKSRGESHHETSSLPDGEKFNSDYPYFSVTLQPTYVRTTYLNVPMQFVKRTGWRPQGKDIKLVVSDKTWNIKMSVLPQYARLHSGWNTFVKDNSLQEGDLCVFELIDDEDITFRVTII